ncbi:MAG: acetyl-CoA carboxylase, carboxyltransferase subunit beta [Nitrospira sp.]|nr:acetyl-CoA carboxylase, carboxyltransferase subunit beta [Nitrospira sp.]MDD9859109.1 acetyl-CoA carboxylase, carboxyltransferase subunit beta [Nitrospira sp.]
MGWLRKGQSNDTAKGTLNVVQGLWVKCPLCRAIVYRKEVDRNFKLCPKCGYHLPLSVQERIDLLLDPHSFHEWDAALVPGDPLAFVDTRPYAERLDACQTKTGRRDAIVTGEGMLHDHQVVLGIFDFGFMGGSMGSVVGEKICRAVDRAVERRHPFLLVTTSGGARMQEGILALMQMAKTAAAVARLHEAGIPFLVLLTDPTFGGVTASVAMLGDVILAEPKALIGFAGPRVIEQTIKQRLPDGFQRAEFLLEHGMIDAIVSRPHLRDTIHTMLRHLMPGASVGAGSHRSC